jgi:hypothetical protein
VSSIAAARVYASSSKAWTKPAHGEVVVERNDNAGEEAAQSSVLASPASKYAGAKLTEDEEGYGYCTQFILRLGKDERWQKAFHRKEIPELPSPPMASPS